MSAPSRKSAGKRLELRTRERIHSEYVAVSKEVRRLHNLPVLTADQHYRLAALKGSLQALAWALSDNAQSPIVAYVDDPDRLEALHSKGRTR